MWDKLLKKLSAFSSAVLSGVDAGGYPYSVRVTPQPDATRQVLRVQLPPEMPIQPGPAGLLCHSHDEQLWNMKSFVVHGQLEQQPAGWEFKPLRLIPGQGMDGFLGDMRTLNACRRAAQKYLEKHHLARPKVHWDEIKALRAEARKDIKS